MALALESQAVGAVSEPVEGSGAEQSVECALAGRLEALGAEAPGGPDDALCGPQVVEDAVSEQTLDEGVAGRTDVFALAQTPLGVAALVGDRLGWQVLFDGGAAARSELPRMGGDELVVAEQAHRGLGGTQPQALAYQREGGGVVGLLELHVAVGVELDPCPHGEFGWARGKWAQELALGLDETGQGGLVLRRRASAARRSPRTFRRLRANSGAFRRTVGSVFISLKATNPWL